MALSGSCPFNSRTVMNIITPRHLVKLDELVSRPQDVNRPRRQSNFARELMLSEFGKLGHLNDGQWADHIDVEPGELIEKRLLAIWGLR